MKNLSKLLAVFALIFAGAGQINAQEPSKEEKDKKIAEVNELVNGGRYTFVATRLISQKNSSKPLAPGYRYVLDISKDTLIVHLPYLDKTQIAPLPTAAGDSILTSTHFSYQLKQTQKGNWTIIIRPATDNINDMGNIRQLKLDVSPLGYSTLRVTGNKSGTVSYYGYIKQHGAEFPALTVR